VHPFEHAIDTPVLTGDYNDWLNDARRYYFQNLSGRTVLEIASGDAAISWQILSGQPGKLTMIDLDPNSKTIKENEFILDDVMTWLPNAPRFDVVICLGLLYHLHSGLHLLEMMVNHCLPQTLILDNVIAPHPLVFAHEAHNVSGSRWVKHGYKRAPFNLNVPFHVINESLDHMGFILEQTHILRYDWFPKSNHWIAEWRAK